jgi:hypothetical protein
MPRHIDNMLSMWSQKGPGQIARPFALLGPCSDNEQPGRSVVLLLVLGERRSFRPLIQWEDQS